MNGKDAKAKITLFNKFYLILLKVGKLLFSYSLPQVDEIIIKTLLESPSCMNGR